MRGAGVYVSRESVGCAEGGVRDHRHCPLQPFLLAYVPGRSCAPGRVELPVASEVGAAVGAERCVEDNRLAEVVVGRCVEGSVAGLAEILAVEFLDFSCPFVLRAADCRERGRAGLRVVVVPFREYGVGVRASEFRSREDVERVNLREGFVECEMSPRHIASAVCPVLGYVAVEIGL